MGSTPGRGSEIERAEGCSLLFGRLWLALSATAAVLYALFALPAVLDQDNTLAARVGSNMVFFIPAMLVLLPLSFVTALVLAGDVVARLKRHGRQSTEVVLLLVASATTTAFLGGLAGRFLWLALRGA